MNLHSQLLPCTVKDIFDISLSSARAKEKILRIFEIGSLDEIIGLEDAERCRAEFLSNKIQIKQLSNHKILEKFSSNNEFVDAFWHAHYIDPKKFNIQIDTLIFDDVVAFYTVYEPLKCLIINDEHVAGNYKQIFDAFWLNSMAPNLNFPKSTAGLFFLPIEETFGAITATVYVDASSEVAYPRSAYQELKKKISIIMQDDYCKSAARIIVIVWANGKEQMLDIWKFTENNVDFTSGALADVKIYHDFNEVNDIGRASSNTLVILGHEEKAYRMHLKKDISDLPSGFIIEQEFFN